MSGLDLLFGFRAHWGGPDSARAEMQFTRAWVGTALKVEPTKRLWRPVGVYHQIVGFFGLSYRRRWFAGLIVLGETGEQRTEPIPIVLTAPQSGREETQ